MLCETLGMGIASFPPLAIPFFGYLLNSKETMINEILANYAYNLDVLHCIISLLVGNWRDSSIPIVCLLIVIDTF